MELIWDPEHLCIRSNEKVDECAVRKSSLDEAMVFMIGYLMIGHLMKLQPNGLQYQRRFGLLGHVKEIRPCCL